MKRFFLFAIIACLAFTASCSMDAPTPVKPFIIISKGRYPDIKQSPGMTDYTYISSNGVKCEFIDSISKYNIGDTIH